MPSELNQPTHYFLIMPKVKAQVISAAVLLVFDFKHISDSTASSVIKSCNPISLEALPNTSNLKTSLFLFENSHQKERDYH
ncbi:MAG: hypothetical protein ABIS36_14960 [Chryseolinea sp.]